MAFPNENQKIFMVTGKGGVGKSVVAAALAQRAAKNGLKTLLVELGEQSFYQYVYHRTVGYEPVVIRPNFSIALWGGHACLREYVYHLVRVKPIVDLFFDNRVMRTFIRAAPALKEFYLKAKHGKIMSTGKILIKIHQTAQDFPSISLEITRLIAQSNFLYSLY